MCWFSTCMASEHIRGILLNNLMSHLSHVKLCSPVCFRLRIRSEQIPSYYSCYGWFPSLTLLVMQWKALMVCGQSEKVSKTIWNKCEIVREYLFPLGKTVFVFFYKKANSRMIAFLYVDLKFSCWFLLPVDLQRSLCSALLIAIFGNAVLLHYWIWMHAECCVQI